MSELVLEKYLLDTVGAVDGQVQMTTWLVLAESPDQALHRFFNEEAGSVFYEGDVVDRILIGIQVMGE